MLVSHTPIHKLRLSKVMLLKVRSPLVDWVLWLTGLAVQTNSVTANQVVIKFGRTELLDGVLQNCTRTQKMTFWAISLKCHFAPESAISRKCHFATGLLDDVL